jgi:general L-amino acid transport system substrate-binding protein
MKKRAILKKLTTLFVALIAVALIASACASDSEDQGLLDEVRDRGRLICGVRDALAGFAVVDDSGNYSGFDVEFCRVVAAGVLGDANAVDFRPLETADRFTALQSGEVDVLIRNTTFTATRDGQEGANFLFTTLYDGQGFLVSADSGISTLEGLEGATICVAQGTTTEQNLSTTFRGRGINFSPLTFDDNTELQSSYEQGQCQSFTGDASTLATYKFTSEQAGGAEQFVIPEVISKEPLGPVVADGDTEWAQAVNWSVMATVQAWEFGLDSSNIGSYSGSDGNVLNFLGQNNFNPGIGLSPDFATNVVSQVGNYQEIYARTLEPLGLPMAGSSNRLWTDSGQHYTSPNKPKRSV